MAVKNKPVASAKQAVFVLSFGASQYKSSSFNIIVKQIEQNTRLLRILHSISDYN